MMAKGTNLDDLEDSLKVLGRVADAFDHPSSHETHKELRLNAIKTHRPQTSHSSQGSQGQHAHFARCDSSFDIGCDGDDELAESLSSTETVTRHLSVEEPSSVSEHTLHQDDTIDITKMASMLLTNSPLERLNYLARVELKKTGWFERHDQWAIVDMGLTDLPLTATPQKPIKAVPALTTNPPVTLPVSESPLPSCSPNSKYCPPTPDIKILPRTTTTTQTIRSSEELCQEDAYVVRSKHCNYERQESTLACGAHTFSAIWSELDDERVDVCLDGESYGTTAQ
ncbi:hypothetical protein HYDPIDRAFT_43804 [Hydnomerulius pinastri MD-312]|uniref:Uncharacterized protein n=1 Tax=Hydnomerulius pinastri MD-312 TaxID=994086 RepID=A0A0C9VQ09_9AGAM|nr:hypothetical protein HYDPIDRAFT_43804 [Hydnomerulius pinastri MD-312]